MSCSAGLHCSACQGHLPAGVFQPQTWQHTCTCSSVGRNSGKHPDSGDRTVHTRCAHNSKSSKPNTFDMVQYIKVNGIREISRSFSTFPSTGWVPCQHALDRAGSMRTADVRPLLTRLMLSWSTSTPRTSVPTFRVCQVPHCRG